MICLYRCPMETYKKYLFCVWIGYSIDIDSVSWWYLYKFPMAAVTNYHKGGGLKQQKFIISQFWRLEVQDQGVCRARLLLKAVGQNLFQTAFLLSDWSWAWGSVPLFFPWRFACRQVCLRISPFYNNSSLTVLGATHLQFYLSLSTDICPALLPNKVTCEVLGVGTLTKNFRGHNST